MFHKLLHLIHHLTACQSCQKGNCCGSCWCCYDRDRRYPVTRRNLTRIADFVTRKQITGRATVRPWCGSILGYIASVVVLTPAEQAYWKDRGQALVKRQPFNPGAYNIPRFDFAGLPVPVRRSVTAEEVAA